MSHYQVSEYLFLNCILDSLEVCLHSSNLITGQNIGIESGTVMMQNTKYKVFITSRTEIVHQFSLIQNILFNIGKWYTCI